VLQNGLHCPLTKRLAHENSSKPGTLSLAVDRIEVSCRMPMLRR
jgi:hypothetical protein